MTNKELWGAALGEIELSISRANFITWFKNTSIISNENGRIVIGVPNGFAKEWLENKYNTYILRALRNFQEDAKEIKCVIHNINDFGLNKPKSVDAIKNPALSAFEINEKSGALEKENCPYINCEANLNPRYNFEGFIVGENNELARAACYAVSQNLGKLYNPLFIYGGVGLGKTHLLQSIGNEIIKQDPAKKIKYITAERFANELIDSIRNQKVNQFKDNYQKIDLLIIDDIQFLSGKEKTQHEFFHVFNALYQLNKQIVISSDRPPKSIPTLEERLRSRFEGGMIADVGKPDLETRTAILQAKISEKNFYMDDEAIKFIAENIKNNIRELEGALNRVIAACEFSKKSPTLSIIKDVLAEIVTSGKKKGIQNRHIIEAIADFFNIDQEKLINKGRKKEVSYARQIAMYLIRNELNTSYAGIGDYFGGRDHSTALHAFEKINKAMKSNEKLKEEIEIIIDKIYTTV